MGTLTVNGSSQLNLIILPIRNQSIYLQGESSESTDLKSANLLFPLESKRKIRVLYIIDVLENFVKITGKDCERSSFLVNM